MQNFGSESMRIHSHFFPVNASLQTVSDNFYHISSHMIQVIQERLSCSFEAGPLKIHPPQKRKTLKARNKKQQGNKTIKHAHLRSKKQHTHIHQHFTGFHTNLLKTKNQLKGVEHFYHLPNVLLTFCWCSFYQQKNLSHKPSHHLSLFEASNESPIVQLPNSNVKLEVDAPDGCATPAAQKGVPGKIGFWQAVRLPFCCLIHLLVWFCFYWRWSLGYISAKDLK